VSIRRVTLALDPSLRELSALAGAVRLAARLNAPLHARLIRDVGLMNFAALPLATEVLSRSGRSRQLAPGQLENEFQRSLATCAAELRRCIGELGVQWSVEAATTEELATRREGELLLISRLAGHAVVRRNELGGLAARLVGTSHQTVMIFRDAPAVDQSVAVLIEPRASGALETAATLAAIRGRLLVLIQAPDQAQYQTLARAAKDHAVTRGIDVATVWLRQVHALSLAHELVAGDCGLLVLDAQASLLHRESLPVLLEALRVPIVLAHAAGD